MKPVPDLSGVLDGWTVPVTIQRVVQQVQEDLSVAEHLEEIQSEANLQPLNSQDNYRMPQEYRTRKIWSAIIPSKSIYLEPNNIIIDPSGKKFRVISSSDWRSSGFTKYDVEEVYDN